MKNLLLLALSFSFVFAITVAVLATPERRPAAAPALAAPPPPTPSAFDDLEVPEAPVLDLAPVVIVSSVSRAHAEPVDDPHDTPDPPPRRCGAWRPLTQGPGAVRTCD